MIENAFDIMAARRRIPGKRIKFHPNKVLIITSRHNYLNKTDSTDSSNCRFVSPNVNDTTRSQWRGIVAGDRSYQI